MEILMISYVTVCICTVPVCTLGKCECVNRDFAIDKVDSNKYIAVFCVTIDHIYSDKKGRLNSVVYPL